MPPGCTVREGEALALALSSPCAHVFHFEWKWRRPAPELKIVQLALSLLQLRLILDRIWEHSPTEQMSNCRQDAQIDFVALVPNRHCLSAGGWPAARSNAILRCIGPTFLLSADRRPSGGHLLLSRQLLVTHFKHALSPRAHQRNNLPPARPESLSRVPGLTFLEMVTSSLAGAPLVATGSKTALWPSAELGADEDERPFRDKWADKSGRRELEVGRKRAEHEAR